MKSVLERIEETTDELSKIKLKDLKLLNIKIPNINPYIGSYRIKGFFNKNTVIEIFEFLFLGEIIKYSYTFIENKITILRYDNAPHHKEIQTHPNHKHLNDKIFALKNPQLIEFIKEVIKLINK